MVRSCIVPRYWPSTGTLANGRSRLDGYIEFVVGMCFGDGFVWENFLPEDFTKKC